MRKWTECFVSRHSSADDRRLFRSLQMAFEAARLPSKYYTSDLDLGRQVSLWVSAHEILINDDESQSLASKVRRKLACFQAITPALNKKSYRHKLGGKYVAHTLAQKAYSCLNDARNDYLHGNRVTPSALRPRGYNASVFQVAPPLFRLLLEVRLFGGAQIQTSQVFALEDLNVMAAEIDRRSEFNSVRETLEQPILAFRHQPLTNKHW